MPQTYFYADAPGAVGEGRTYDASMDGRRFVMIEQGAGSDQNVAPPNIVVVQNFEDLKRLVPRK